MKDELNDQIISEREKVSLMGLNTESPQAEQLLQTDIRKYNKNKFFYNINGEEK